MELLSIFVEKFSLLNLPKCDEKDKKKKEKEKKKTTILIQLKSGNVLRSFLAI